jgi:hypothetical protein
MAADVHARSTGRGSPRYTESVELRCSCGAAPPPDARFCHKCGRPLYEEDAALLEEAQQAAAPIPTPVPVSAAPATAISFRNMRAVGVSIAFAAATFVALVLFSMALPGVAMLATPLLLAAGGFASAVVYARQTRQPLSGASGARLGWMTGVWFFLASLILVTIGVTVLSGPVGDTVLAQMRSNPQFANYKFPNTKELASNALAGTIQIFFLAVLFPIFGGIAGARFASRNRPSA